jgi:hypothetical protein
MKGCSVKEEMIRACITIHPPTKFRFENLPAGIWYCVVVLCFLKDSCQNGVSENLG